MASTRFFGGVRGERTRHRWLVGTAAAALVGTGILTPVAAQAADPSADLSVAVTHSPDSGLSTQPLTFTITASNAGPDTAQAVVAGLAFDYPLEFVEADAGCERSNANNSVICQLGDVASGASASADIVVRPYSSGVFTVPGVVSSPTPDPDGADHQTTDSVIVTKGPSQAKRYLSAIFPIILDRPIDPASLAYWTPRWRQTYVQYPNRHEVVPAGIIRGTEYRRMRVREAYLRILGRAADAPSLAYWIAKIGNGLSYDRFEQHLIGSNEWAAKHPTGQVAAVFQAVLRRPATQAEIDYMAPEFEGPGTTPLYLLASYLQHGTEGYDVVINDRWQRTFGEAPTALGRYVWQVKLRQGVSPETLWSQLLVTWDVLRDYPLTEDDYNVQPGVPVFDFHALTPLG